MAIVGKDGEINPMIYGDNSFTQQNIFQATQDYSRAPTPAITNPNAIVPMENT